MKIRKKQERNLEILYKAIEQEPENPYFYFQTGCSLQVLHKFEEAAAMYEKGLSNRKIYDAITAAGYNKENITGDSAEPKSIDELKGYGLRIKGAEKGRDSIKNGIQWIQDLEIIIHPRCVNFLTEISNYTWDKDKFDNKLNKPIDDFNHLMDAMRYALEKYIKGNKWLY